MPIRQTDKGWFWGSKGPFKTKKKATDVARAAYSSGYKKGEMTCTKAFLDFLQKESDSRKKQDDFVEAVKESNK